MTVKNEMPASIAKHLGFLATEKSNVEVQTRKSRTGKSTEYYARYVGAKTWLRIRKVEYDRYTKNDATKIAA